MDHCGTEQLLTAAVRISRTSSMRFTPALPIGAAGTSSAAECIRNNVGGKIDMAIWSQVRKRVKVGLNLSLTL